MTRAGALSQRLRVLVPTLLATALVTGFITAQPMAAQAEPKQPSAGDLQKKIDAITTQMDLATDKYNTSNHQLGVAKSQKQTVTKQISAKRVEVDKLKKQAGQYATSVYKGADMSAYSSVLTSKTPQTFIQQMSTLNALTGTNQRKLTQLTDGQKLLLAQQKKLDGLVTTATNLQKSLTTQKAAYQKELDKYEKLKDKVDPSVAEGSTKGKAPKNASAAVAFAYDQLGEPYKWGAEGPGSWDCSGLTMMAYQQIGVSLPHSAGGQRSQLTPVSRSEVRSGDLVFGPGHVGIAISNGKMIHAPTENQDVKIASIDTSLDFTGAGRP